MTQRPHSDDAASTARTQERATLVRAQLPAGEFALSETFSAVPDLTIECVRIVASGTQTVLPLLWTTTDDHAALQTALSADPSVETAQQLLQADSRRLYRFHWSDDVHLICRVLLGPETVLLEGFGSDSSWTFELLFPSREVLSRVCERCDLYDVQYSIDRIQGLEDDRGDDQRTARFGLTPEQHEAIVVAYKHGYFAVPRQITLDELAAHLDISHQALSERLRRAHDTLLGEHLKNACFGVGLDSTPDSVGTAPMDS